MSDSSVRPSEGFGASDTPALRQRAAKALAPFGFYDSQKGEMIDAYLEAPDGVDAVIADALDSEVKGKLRQPPRAVILVGIRRGDHLRAKLDPGPRKTGWRVVPGVGHAALSYQPDKNGTDPLPEVYDFVTSNPHKPGEWRDAQTEVERRAKKTQKQLAEDEE